MMKSAVSYRKELMTILKDPEEASAYLNAALEAGDKKAFLLALRNILEARGGMTQISRQSKINRVSLYKMLSSNGNPAFDNILRLLRTTGIRLHVVPKTKD
jgi:probable addiction module antidote protein